MDDFLILQSHPKKQRTDSITDEFDETNPFTKGSQFDEIELKFDTGESLFISKSFISYASPVFKRMFQSQFKESSSKCVKLTGKKYNVFLDMLLNMHPRIGKPISGNYQIIGVPFTVILRQMRPVKNNQLAQQSS